MPTAFAMAAPPLPDCRRGRILFTIFVAVLSVMMGEVARPVTISIFLQASFGGETWQPTSAQVQNKPVWLFSCHQD